MGGGNNSIDWHFSKRGEAHTDTQTGIATFNSTGLESKLSYKGLFMYCVITTNWVAGVKSK